MYTFIYNQIFILHKMADRIDSDIAVTISIEAIGSGLLIIPVMYCSNAITVRELKDNIMQHVPSLIDHKCFDIDLFNGHGGSVLNDESQLCDEKILDNSVLTLMRINDEKKALIKFCGSFDKFFPIANEWHLANPITNWLGIKLEIETFKRYNQSYYCIYSFNSKFGFGK